MPRGGKKLKFSEKKQKEIIKLYKLGYSVLDLANRYGHGFGTIRRVLIQNDVGMRGRGAQKKGTMKKEREGPVIESKKIIKNYKYYLRIEDERIKKQVDKQNTSRRYLGSS